MFAIIMLIVLLLAIGFVIFVLLLSRNDNEDIQVYEEVRSQTVLQILVPRENEKTPLAAEQMFASIHGILRDSKKSLDLVSFEIASSFERGICFYVVTPNHLAKFIEGQVYAQYPTAVITHVQDYTQLPAKTAYLNGMAYQPHITTGEIELSKDFVFPIRTFRDFEVDPLAAITSAMSGLKEGEEVWLQLVIRPISDYWQDDSKKYITAIREGRDPATRSLLRQFLTDMVKAFSNVKLTGGDGSPAQKEVVKLAPGQDEELRKIEEKMVKLGFEFNIRIVTKAGEQLQSEQLFRDIVASFKQYTTAHLNSFVHSSPDVGGEAIYNRYISRYLASDPIDIINIEELASIFHMPNNSVETPNINWSRSRKAEPPMNLPIMGDDVDVNVFAETDYRNERIPFGIKRGDRRRHMYLLGKTGVGKSSTFKNMFIADIHRGDGACFIDPHGQDVEEILDYIPPNRIDDVIYFDPGDIENPIAFNLLELDNINQRDLLTDGVVSVFKKQFEDSWGPRLQYILQNAIATCIEAQNTTILSVQRILLDKNYRKFVLKHVNDPILLKFWNEEFAQMSQNSRLVTEAIAPIQNKIGRFISSAVIRNMVGQVKSTVKLREAMDSGKIVLVNLAQGKIGEESAALLGGMFITKLQSGALERIDIPEEQRRDFFLFVDEFQNFATDSFAKILSEARKFKLNLTMTNQYIEQIPMSVRHAIFGNVGTLASFVVSQGDAVILSNEFAPTFSAEDLVALEAHSVYMKLCIDGMTSKPFSARSLDFRTRFQKYGLKEQILAASRAKYGRPKAEVEDKIIRWSNQVYSEKGNRSVTPGQGQSKKKHEESRVNQPGPHSPIQADTAVNSNESFVSAPVAPQRQMAPVMQDADRPITQLRSENDIANFTSPSVAQSNDSSDNAQPN